MHEYGKLVSQRRPAMIFSVDLRKRVVAAIDNGKHVDDVVETFDVSRRVIYNWLELRQETGSLEPKVGYQKGHSHKITDWNEFKKFAENNKQQTIKSMRIEWARINNKSISHSVMQRALKKIGFTSKKKHLATKKLI